MCLIINHRNLKIATRDITVYKMLIKDFRGRVCSPFRFAKYEFNKLKEDNIPTDIRKNKKGDRIVTKGFLHAYRTVDAATRAIEEYTTINKVPDKHSLVIHKAVSPAGTKYYEGIWQDICAKALTVLEESI